MGEMDDCEKIRLELSAYAAGRLDPGMAGAVAEHLRGCPACRDEEAAIRETLGVLRRELVPVPTPAGLAAGVLSRLHAGRRASSSRILSDPRYQALSLPVGDRVARTNWKRHSAVFVLSLALNAAAAVVVIALCLKLSDSGNGQKVATAPRLAVVDARPAANPAREIITRRESRPAILLNGTRVPGGAVRVNVAQFVDEAVLTLDLDTGLGCLKAFYPAARATGTECRVAKAQLTIPAALAGIFHQSLQMRIVEMDDCLEIWPRQQWDDTARRALAAARPADAPANAPAVAAVSAAPARD